MKKKSIILIVLLSGMLLVSIVGNFIGYQKIYYGFDRYNDSRLDPIGQLDGDLDSQAHGFHEVVLLGDSHARHWDFQSASKLNLGISSQTSVQIEMRSRSYAGNIQGKRLIVIAGANDLKSVMTNMNRKDKIVQNCLNSIRMIVEHHESSFQEIVLVTIPPIFSVPLEYRLLYSKAVDEVHKAFNDGIREIAEEKSLTLLDAYEILSAHMEEEKLSSDGIHLNRLAYSYLEKELH